MAIKINNSIAVINIFFDEISKVKHELVNISENSTVYIKSNLFSI